MPNYLRSLLLFEVALLVSAALVMPFFESGVWRIIGPVVNVALIALCFAFYRRVRHTDRILSNYCVIGVTFALVYFASIIPTGEIAVTPENILLALETVALAALFVLLRSELTDLWFHSKDTDSTTHG